MNRAANVERLGIDAGGDLDRRVPGHFTFVLFDLDVHIGADFFHASFRRWLRAELADQAVVRRRLQLDGSWLWPTRRLRERVCVTAACDLRGDQQDGRALR